MKLRKKFQLTAEEKARLLDGAELVKSKRITDVYYDTSDYKAIKADWWLRRRDGEFQLKIPIETGDAIDTTANMYHELETESEIRRALQLSVETRDLAADLTAAGYLPFIEARSDRKSYHKDGFTIDVDSVTYADSDFTYSLAEVETLIEDESAAAAAVQRIDDYVAGYGIETNQETDGKIVAFMRANLPGHYGALLERKRATRQ